MKYKNATRNIFFSSFLKNKRSYLEKILLVEKFYFRYSLFSLRLILHFIFPHQTRESNCFSPPVIDTEFRASSGIQDISPMTYHDPRTRASSCAKYAAAFPPLLSALLLSSRLIKPPSTRGFENFAAPRGRVPLL